jgi:AdoMet-dependent heme synthase
LGVKSVTVSVDSHQPAVHDHLRQLPGLHSLAVRAISLLTAKGVRVVVGFTPTKLNWKDGPEVIKLAKSLGASAVNLSEYVPSGRGTINLALTPDELRETLEAWIKLRKEYEGQMEIIWHDCRVGMIVPESERRDYVGCGAGRLVARILPDGVVTPCVFLSTPIGSLRSSSFAEMWAASPVLQSFRERKGHITGNCGDCEFLATCGGCRAVAFAYSKGNALAGDPHCWVKREGVAQSLSDLPAGESLPI